MVPFLIRAVTDFGDAAVLAPLSLAIFLCLWAHRERHVGGAWLAATGSCLATIVILKLAFRTCGDAANPDAIISPSGHAAFAATVYGSLAVLIATRLANRWQRVLLGIGTAAWLVAIGATRVMIQAHIPDEVLIGLGVGAACVFLFWRLSRESGNSSRPLATLVLVAVILMVTLHGEHANAESLLIDIAHALRHTLANACPA